MGMFGNLRGFDPSKAGGFGRGTVLGPLDFPRTGADDTPSSMASFPSASNIPEPSPAPHGFFAPGGTGRNIIGGIGDALIQLGGGKPTFAPMMEQRRQQQFTAQQAQATQQAELQRQLAVKAFERANPTPDDFTKTLIAAGIDPQSPEGIAAYRQKVEHSYDPTVTVTLPNNAGIYAGPQSGLAAALGGNAPVSTASAPPEAAISLLRSNPGAAAQFDAKYGAGASARYLGGAAPQAPVPLAR